MDARELLKIGDQHAKRGEANAAIDAYRKAATFYRENGFLLKALALCRQMLVLDPTRADIQAERAELTKDLGLDS